MKMETEEQYFNTPPPPFYDRFPGEPGTVSWFHLGFLPPRVLEQNIWG